jgi:hypothetical protein
MSIIQRKPAWPCQNCVLLPMNNFASPIADFAGRNLWRDPCCIKIGCFSLLLSFHKKRKKGNGSYFPMQNKPTLDCQEFYGIGQQIGNLENQIKENKDKMFSIN